MLGDLSLYKFFASTARVSQKQDKAIAVRRGKILKLIPKQVDLEVKLQISLSALLSCKSDRLVKNTTINLWYFRWVASIQYYVAKHQLARWNMVISTACWVRCVKAGGNLKLSKSPPKVDILLLQSTG